MGLAARGGASVDQNAWEKRGSVNIETAICNDHLHSPWGQH